MTATGSVQQITSPDHFQQFIQKAGPDTLVALNFWAPWASPCEQMNRVFAELAQTYPTVTFAQVPLSQTGLK
jgi:thiol-disulfide isomerase/thioredoxin